VQLPKKHKYFNQLNLKVMKKNMGSTDKIIRIIIALVVGVLYYTETISGTTALVLGAFAIILLITSFINFCPLYLPFGLSTRKKE
jgi:hypothetical protein